MFKLNDIIFVSNPDIEYEREMGGWKHKAFFGCVTEVETFGTETVVTVEFPAMPNGASAECSYNEEELSHASELRNMTLEDFSNHYGVSVLAEYMNSTYKMIGRGWIGSRSKNI